MNLINRYCIIILLLLAACYEHSYTQKSPYPIIFVHGINSNDKTWEKTKNILKKYKIYNIFDVNDKDMPNKGIVYHICLNNNFSSTNYKDDIFDDFSINDNLKMSDVYLINYDVMLDKTMGVLFYPSEDYDKRKFYKNHHQSMSNQSAIFKQGCALGKAIKKILDVSKANKVILVGHSMGGLSIREYLQRIENEKHIWWAEKDDSNYRHCVAKVVTIGTPHLGFNEIEWADSRISYVRFSDLKSEAIRDLRQFYKQDKISFQGRYLFGGSEKNYKILKEAGGNEYYNADVNCNGNSDDIIIGLNANNSFNKSLALPKNIDYCWITSKFLTLDGDFIVNLNNQWLHSGNFPEPSGITETFHTNKIHTSEPEDYFSIIRGIDEPDNPDLAYEIKVNHEYNGMATIQSFGDKTKDVDCYKFIVPEDGNFNIDFTPVKDLKWNIEVYSSNPSAHSIQPVISFNRNNNNFSVPCKKGQIYFIKIIHQNISSDSWKTPYKYKVIYKNSNGNNIITKYNDYNITIFHVDASKAPYQVQLYCSVTDMNGNFVKNLAPPYNYDYKEIWQQLIETINQKEFGIDKYKVGEYRAQVSPPFTSSFVLDYSGSMQNDIHNLEFALSKLINYLRKNKDEFSIVQFDHSIYNSVPVTKNPEDLSKIMNYSQLGGATAFYDASLQGLNNLNNSNNQKVAILFTDGLDNRSVSDANKLVDLARSLNCRVFVIGLAAADKSVLTSIAEQSNGKAYFPQQSSEFDNIFSEIYNFMKSYYVITYTPQTKVNARMVKLGLQLPNTSNIQYSTRNYFLKPELIKDKDKKFCLAMFDDGSYDISDKYKGLILETVNKLVANRNMRISLFGHSCSYDSKKKEERESTKLARIIYNFMIQNGVKINQIKKVIGYGYEEPVYFDDNDPIKRKENRRVEVVYEKK